MSSPVRKSEPRHGENELDVVWTVKRTHPIRAPRAGKLKRRKRGLVVVTDGGSAHRIYEAFPLGKLVGKRVKDGQLIGESCCTKVWYRWKGSDGRIRDAMRVVNRPVPAPRPVVAKPWKGLYTLTAGEYYSSGAYHGAWDLAMPTGTPLYSPMNGVIAQRNDGVKNNKPGHNPGRNAPSCYVYVQGKDAKGRKRSCYLQHMSPGLKVSKGQKVKAGQLVGYSGNTGNSTAPHLHVHVMVGWQSDRYRLYKDRSVTVYKPSKLWNG